MSFLLLCSFKSFSLGQTGHQVVCQVAFDHLSEQQKNNINALLKHMPSSHKARLNKYTKSKKNADITFAKSCVWADAIKKMDSFKQYNSWHYLNVSRDTQSIENAVCKKDCIGQAIIKHQQQLATEKDSWKKLQALMFLGHWLGDIHQPLHISYANDWGGNKVKITAKSNSRCESLHWYWDDCVLSKQNKSFNQWITFLSKDWDNTTVKSWQPNNVWEWANESYQIVTSPAFKYCKKTQDVCKSYPKNKVTLPADYQAHFTPIINQQMLLAAKRLANVLTTTL